MPSHSAPAHQIERQLIAILAADVAGYSRLVGADEEGTLAQLRACRQELIEPCIAAHQGGVVKTTGDGRLVRFASPVEATRCAVEIQQGMTERNSDLPDHKRLQFRIGINLGDVIVENGDIFGDGVMSLRAWRRSPNRAVSASRDPFAIRSATEYRSRSRISENNRSKISRDRCT